MKLSRFLLAIMFSSLLQTTFALDSTYMRNGEAYLSVSGLKTSGSSTSDDGIYRLNDPEGAGLYLGKVINGISQLHTFSVDLYRKIYTMSEPNEVNVSDDWTIKRQVVDGSEVVLLNSTVETGSLSGKKKVDTINWTGGGVNVNANVVDYGCHSYTHNDYRWKRQNRPFFYINPAASPLDPTGSYGTYDGRSQYQYPNRRSVGDTQGDPVYRFNDGSYSSKNNSSVPGPNSSGSNAARRIKYADGDIRVNASEGRFRILQGTPTTAPDDPETYMPCATSTNAVYLPVYANKDWYEIPNGSWYSSWRARACCSSGTNPGLPSTWTTSQRRIFYQVYCDYCDVLEKNWRLVTYGSGQSNFQSYSQIGSGDDFGTTTTEQWARAVLAGCLDGCGGSSGNAAVAGSRYLFDVAFMPNSSDTVTVYTYNRREDADKGKVAASVNNTVVKLYDTNVATTTLTTTGVSGLGRDDTKWIGVSKGKINDYLYMLGTTQIKTWVNSATTTMDLSETIDAVTVSNQWDEKGGMIFAFNKAKGYIYKFKLDEDGNAIVYPGIDVKTIQDIMKSDGEIDDIATDGFGNVYLSATYPSNSTENIPAKLKWHYDDATSVDIAEQDDHYNLTFYFSADFRKTVRKISATGEDLSEVGSRLITTRSYSSQTQVDRASYTAELASTLADYNSRGNFNGISSMLEQLGISEGNISLILTGDVSDVDIQGSSKLAVINTPTPPEVKHLGSDTASYLDICGPYSDYIQPGPLDALGRMPLNQRAGQANPVESSKVHFFMVENYPLINYQRNPNVDPNTNDQSVWNPDGDYRRSGFVNTIIEDNTTGKLSIDYNWGVYRIRDYEPLLNPEGSYASSPVKLMSRSNENFAVLYAPNKGNYIITCSAKYRFRDYDTVQFGETISEWESRTGGIASQTARAAGVVPGTPPAPNDIAIADVVNEVRNYAALAYSVSTSDTIVENILNYIDTKEYNDTGLHLDSNNIAVQYVVTGDVGSWTPPVDVARIERHNVDPAVGTHGGTNAANETINGYNWGPTSGMTPTDGFHGLQEGRTYYWRIAPASQSIFLSDSIATDSSVYSEIADRLASPSDPLYVQGDPSFRFVRGESNITWQKDIDGNVVPLSVKVELLDANNNIVKSWNDVSLLKSYTNGSGEEYKYIDLGGDLVVSDPYEYTLNIEFSRFFMYDMFIYNATDNTRITNFPVTLPKKLTITGSTKLMVMDNTIPNVEIDQTKICNSGSATFISVQEDNVIKGETGKPLVGKIAFTISDNNYNEIIATGSHNKWDVDNLEYNKNNLNKDDPSINLMPTFKPDSSYVRIIYAVPEETSDLNKDVLNSYVASPTTDTFYGAMNSSGAIATYSELNSSWSVYSSGNLSKTNSGSNSGKSYYTYEYNLTNANHTMPFSYANNSPGYNPIKFAVEARDCSGNVMTIKELPCVVDIIDTINPIPYVRIKEFKDNRSMVLPNITKLGSAIATDTAHYSSELKFGVSGSGIASSTIQNNITIGDYNLYLPKYDGYVITHIASGSYSDYQVPGDNIIVEDGVQVYFRAGAMDNSGASRVTKFRFKYVKADGNEANYISEPTDQIATITASPRVGQSVAFHESNDVAFTYAIPIEVTVKDNARGYDSYPYTINNNEVIWGSKIENNEDKSHETKLQFMLPVYGTKTNIRTIEKYTKPTN